MNLRFYYIFLIIGISVMSCKPPAPFITPATGRIESTSNSTQQSSSVNSKTPDESKEGTSSEAFTQPASDKKSLTPELSLTVPAGENEQRPQYKVTDSSPPDIQGDIESIGLNKFPDDKGFEVQKEFWLDLVAPSPVQFAPKLRKGEDNFDGFVAIERKEEQVRFKVRFPEKGTFHLTLWAKDQTSNDYNSFVAYQITATEGIPPEKDE